MDEKKRKVGRPRFTESVLLDSQITIKFSSIEKDTLRDLARRDGQTLSTFVREAFIKYAWPNINGYEDPGYIDPDYATFLSMHQEYDEDE